MGTVETTTPSKKSSQTQAGYSAHLTTDDGLAAVRFTVGEIDTVYVPELRLLVDGLQRLLAAGEATDAAGASQSTTCPDGRGWCTDHSVGMDRPCTSDPHIPDSADPVEDPLMGVYAYGGPDGVEVSIDLGDETLKLTQAEATKLGRRLLELAALA